MSSGDCRWRTQTPACARHRQSTFTANDDQRPSFDVTQDDRGSGGLLMRTSRSTNTGQAATETMISMLFLMLMIWGLVHLSMFAVSKYVANYAAWAAARTAMVHGA